MGDSCETHIGDVDHEYLMRFFHSSSILQQFKLHCLYTIIVYFKTRSVSKGENFFFYRNFFLQTF